MRVIAGREALSAVADYMDDSGNFMSGLRPRKDAAPGEPAKQPVQMVEYMTWVRSASTHAFSLGGLR